MKTNRAISPVLATIILIAITLIAAIAIAGFVFGLFGTFEAPAQVSATSDLSSANGLSGTITFYNRGLSSADLQSISMTYLGQTCRVSYSAGSNTIQAGGALTVQVLPGDFPSNECGQEGTASVAQSGAQYLGIATVGAGVRIPFTGVFQ